MDLTNFFSSFFKGYLDSRGKRISDSCQVSFSGCQPDILSWVLRRRLNDQLFSLELSLSSLRPFYMELLFLCADLSVSYR